MIKINLAKKKQVSYSANESSAKSGTMSSLRAFGASADSSDLVSILSRILLPLALCGVLYFAFNHFIEIKEDELKMDVVNVDKEKTKIQDELKKIRGFEAQKVELERTEQVINAKIDTIEQLIRGKDNTVKAMIALSQALPKDVWITEIIATEKTFNIRGNTIDMGLVSDVMSKLGTSIYYKDVSLKGSAIDSNGRQATFELTARRE
jgi:hypothetical protein